jgi:hypothetical protein
VLKKTSKFSLLVLLVILLAPVSRVHAQATTSEPQTDVVTGTDPEPTGEPKVLTGFDSESSNASDVMMGSDPEPAGEPGVVTGTDPEPTGEPHGDTTTLQALAIATFITFRLS